MVCFILCPECSKDLGEVYPFIFLVQKGYNQKLIDEWCTKNNNNIDLEKIQLNPNIIKNYNKIYETLGISNMCCKMHLIGLTEYDHIE